MNQECDFCQHRDAVYLAEIGNPAIDHPVGLCATCIKVFPEAEIVGEADTRNM
jgi:hypothetical protein